MPIGGNCWDLAFSEYIEKLFKEQGFDYDISTLNGQAKKGAQDYLLKEALRAKLELCTGADYAEIQLNKALLGRGERTDYCEIKVTLNDFDNSTSKLLEQVLRFTERFIENNNARRLDDFKVVLVGGASRMP